MIRVQLPYHLRTLAKVDGEIAVDVGSPATYRAVIEAIESQYPALIGTIRDFATNERRPFLRIFACGGDVSDQPLDSPLPDPVQSAAEPLLIIGAIAGG